MFLFRHQDNVGRKVLLAKLPAKPEGGDKADMIEGYSASGFCADHEMTGKKGDYKNLPYR